MFNFISWSQYIIFLVIALLVYYLLIGLLFFRAEIAGIFNRDKVRTISFPHLSSHEAAEETDNSMQFPAVHELLEDLKAVIGKNSRKELPKEELLMTLKEQVNKYPQLRDTSFAASISNFLHQELPQLDDVDLNRLWK